MTEQASTTGQHSLATKLANVMRKVKYIQKRGRNTFHKYNYATEADVADAVRDALAEQNVIMLPSVVEHGLRELTSRAGNPEFICMVVMDFTFVDGDSGETLTARLIGEGQDSGDKAFYKAVSGTTKYAIMKTFLIPTGDDPEQDSGETEGKGNPPAPVAASPATPQTDVPRPAASRSRPPQSVKAGAADGGKADFTGFWSTVNGMGKSQIDVAALVPPGQNIASYTQAQLDGLLAKLREAA